MANTYKMFGTGKNKKKYLLTLEVGTKKDADFCIKDAKKMKLHARKVVLPNGRIQIWTRRPWYKKTLEKELKQKQKKKDKKTKKIRSKLMKEGKWS